VSVNTVKVIVAKRKRKKEIQFPLNKLILLWPIGTKISVWVAFIKRQLRITIQTSVIKVNVNEIEIQFPSNYFSLLRPIDTKLGVMVACIKTLPGLLQRCL
jgi:hypothetical protein